MGMRKYRSGVKSRTGKATVQRLARQKESLQLRIQGFTIQQIADKLGCAYAVARSDVASALKGMGEEERTHLRKIKLEEYSILKTQWRDMALSGSEKAATIYMNILQAETKLFGLNAPERSEVEVKRDDDVVSVEVLSKLPIEVRKKMLGVIDAEQIGPAPTPEETDDPLPKKTGFTRKAK